MSDKNRTLILGLGNILMGDEGVGVKSVEFMLKQNIPENVDIVDGGTGGFHLLSLFDDYEKVIMIDATISDGKKGELCLIKPKFSSDFPRSLTSHDIGLKDLMQSAELIGDLPEMFLITVNIQDLRDVGIGLTKEIEACLPLIYEKVLTILSN